MYVIHINISYTDKAKRNLAFVENKKSPLSSYLNEIADDVFIHFRYRSATMLVLFNTEED